MKEEKNIVDVVKFISCMKFILSLLWYEAKVITYWQKRQRKIKANTWFRTINRNT